MDMVESANVTSLRQQGCCGLIRIASDLRPVALLASLGLCSPLAGAGNVGPGLKASGEVGDWRDLYINNARKHGGRRIKMQCFYSYVHTVSGYLRVPLSCRQSPFPSQ